jgi:replicative DNA helicase
MLEQELPVDVESDAYCSDHAMFFQSVEIEQCVIGSIVMKPDKVIRIVRLKHVHEDWFTDPKMRAIFNAIDKLDIEKGLSAGAIQSVAICQLIREEKFCVNVTQQDIDDAIEKAITPAHCMYYIEKLKNLYDKRQLRDLFVSMQSKLRSSDDASDIIADAIFQISGMKTDNSRNQSPQEVIGKITSLFRSAKEKGCTGIKSRWLQVQRLLGGYQRAAVTMIAGQSKKGKTTYALNEALFMARKGYRVGIISLEMLEGQLREKMIGDELDLDLISYRNGEATDAEIELFEKTGLEQAKLPIEIIDGSKNIEEICAIIMSKVGEWDVVIIDFIQNITDSKRDPHKRDEQVARHIRMINAAVIDTNMVGLVLSQFSRDAAVNREGTAIRPKPKHLKGSSALEQLCSALIFIFPELWLRDEQQEDKVPTVVNVNLNRFGPTGDVEMFFMKSQQKMITKEEATFTDDFSETPDF